MRGRQWFARVGMVAVGGAILAAGFNADQAMGQAQQTPASASVPTVTGPIKNTSPLKDGAHGYPFNATPMDLKKAGYVEEEFFMEGTASRFAMSNNAN
ncbi:MAG TPA: alpha/beta hydrolase domain-containing protein, partial [Terriglobia bacterium]|nr:alpha/beta hydrolase domain-containing protein [Terriglobia bacterium]